MPEPLKNLYNADSIRKVISELQQFTNINESKFVSDTFENPIWENLELKPRMKQIAIAIENQLANNYGNYSEVSFQAKAEIIIKYSKFLLGDAEENMNFIYMFLPDYIEANGINHFDISMVAFEEITKFTSCEFAIRPFILKYPETLDILKKWSNHQNVMVRRLSSEGSRPRLPWGMALPIYKKDPTPIFPILDNLINDPSETVRRSVANNLNDICKDNPNIAIEIGKKWLQHNPNNENVSKLVKHGLRTLLKSGNQDALEIFGIKHDNLFGITDFQLEKNEIQLGEKLFFDFKLINDKGEKPSKVRVEHVVYFQKSNGKLSPKVFQIGEYELQPNEVKSLKRSHLFRDFTTRKHYAGLHKISIKLNGIEVAALDFELIF